MKKYIVIKINCHKGLDITNIYEFVKSRVKFKKNFFEFNGLFKHKNGLNSSIKLLYDDIGLDKFEHTKVLNHLSSSPYYNPARDDLKLVSNLDDNWIWHNEQNNRFLSDTELSKLIVFTNQLKVNDVSTLMLGLDEIEWDGSCPRGGTYGYDKARSTYHLGDNYLSNSITIGRDYQSTSYTVCISCEDRFREYAIIKDLIDFLGEVKAENEYFAPENDDERSEWRAIYLEASDKYNTMILGIKKLDLEPIVNWDDDGKTKVNIRKFIKEHLCTNGWDFVKKHSNEQGIKIGVNKGDSQISITVVSGHNGHHLQLIVCYDNPKFYFSKNVCYSAIYISEPQIATYFRNVRIIRDYILNVL